MHILGNKAYLSSQKIGLVLLVAGVVFFAGAFFLNQYQKSREKILSFSEVPQLATVCSTGQLPVKISISSLKIELVVTPATVSGDLWEISQAGVSYLTGSGIPGQAGNMIIYGHNLKKIFGPLPWIKKDSEIKIENKKGENFIYEVIETKTVSPQQIEVLLPSEDSRLTLYTCTGALDSKRFIVVAKLK